jgi:hypothetical protein
MTQDPISFRGLVEPGTFEALADLSFTKFVTIRIVKLLYLMLLVLIGLLWLIGVIAIAGQVGVLTFGGFLSIVALTLLVLIKVIGARIGLELIVVLFRIGENTSITAGRSLER